MKKLILISSVIILNFKVLVFAQNPFDSSTLKEANRGGIRITSIDNSKEDVMKEEYFRIIPDKLDDLNGYKDFCFKYEGYAKTFNYSYELKQGSQTFFSTNVKTYRDSDNINNTICSIYRKRDNLYNNCEVKNLSGFNIDKDKELILVLKVDHNGNKKEIEKKIIIAENQFTESCLDNSKINNLRIDHKLRENSSAIASVEAYKPEDNVDVIIYLTDHTRISNYYDYKVYLGDVEIYRPKLLMYNGGFSLTLQLSARETKGTKEISVYCLNKKLASTKINIVGEFTRTIPTTEPDPPVIEPDPPVIEPDPDPDPEELYCPKELSIEAPKSVNIGETITVNVKWPETENVDEEFIFSHKRTFGDGNNLIDSFIELLDNGFSFDYEIPSDLSNGEYQLKIQCGKLIETIMINVNNNSSGLNSFSSNNVNGRLNNMPSKRDNPTFIAKPIPPIPNCNGITDIVFNKTNNKLTIKYSFKSLEGVTQAVVFARVIRLAKGGVNSRIILPSKIVSSNHLIDEVSLPDDYELNQKYDISEQFEIYTLIKKNGKWKTPYVKCKEISVEE